MRYEERPPEDSGLSQLLDAAFAELVSRYGPEGRSRVTAGARYLVAVSGGEAVGCVALQPTEVPGTGEIKRMYVAPAARGRGLARGLLKEAEELAARLGHTRLRLTTGHLQPEAVRLYATSGYEPAEPWGKYVTQPGVHSFAKALAA